MHLMHYFINISFPKGVIIFVATPIPFRLQLEKSRVEFVNSTKKHVTIRKKYFNILINMTVESIELTPLL